MHDPHAKAARGEGTRIGDSRLPTTPVAAALAILASTALVVACSGHALRVPAAVALGAMVLVPYVATLAVARAKGDRGRAGVTLLLGIIVAIAVPSVRATPPPWTVQIALFGLLLIYFAGRCAAAARSPRRFVPGEIEC